MLGGVPVGRSRGVIQDLQAGPKIKTEKTKTVRSGPKTVRSGSKNTVSSPPQTTQFQENATPPLLTTPSSVNRASHPTGQPRHQLRSAAAIGASPPPPAQRQCHDARREGRWEWGCSLSAASEPKVPLSLHHQVVMHLSRNLILICLQQLLSLCLSHCF